MPRLFTAIEIPEAIRLHLSLIRAPLAGAKWIEPDDMHITLRFVGDVDGHTADEFASLLAGIRARPFTVSIQGVGSFGGREPKVLWAGVAAGEDLDTLHRANERAARGAGLEPEGRAFKAHVTLARMRGGRQQAVARFLEENGGLRTQPFTATRFVLLSARPGSGGGPYVVEAEFPFEGTVGLDEVDEHDQDPRLAD
jgi:RNA 2',3'-cyclic 3'-phosphodiesterase